MLTHQDFHCQLKSHHNSCPVKCFVDEALQRRSRIKSFMWLAASRSLSSHREQAIPVWHPLTFLPAAHGSAGNGSGNNRLLESEMSGRVWKKRQKIRKFRVTRGSYCFGNYSPGMERDPLPDVPPHTATFSIAELFISHTSRFSSPLSYISFYFLAFFSFNLCFLLQLAAAWS